MSFAAGVGRWRGSAEVYDGAGTHLGPGIDSRVVRQIADGIVEVDVSFDGPFSFAGTYRIADEPGGRAYEGPLNHGFAEAIGTRLVDAHSFWPALGMSQRFCLMVDPDGDRQLSLALLSRGEQLRYVVVGENVRVDSGLSLPARADGALLDRSGTWEGTLSATGGDLAPLDACTVREVIDGAVTTTTGIRADGVVIDTAVAFDHDATSAWTTGGGVVGSWSTYGGRARAGAFVHTAVRLRVSSREVVSRDGARKAVVQQWFRGGRRVGIVHGVLAFTPS